MNTSAQTLGKTVIPPPPAYTASPAAQVRSGPPAGPQGTPDFHKTFLKARPKALGTVMILAALFQIALGIALISTYLTISFASGIPFWGSVCYIIAGSLNIAANSKPNICLVKGSLSLNIISSIFSISAFILNCVDLALFQSFDNNYNYYYNSWYYEDTTTGGYVILSILLITNLLLFCVSLSVSIFGCRSLAHVTVPQVFMIQNDVVISTNPSVVPGTF